MSQPPQQITGMGDILSYQLQNSIINELFASIKSINISVSDTYTIISQKLLYILGYGLLVMTLQNLVMKGNKEFNIISYIFKAITTVFSNIFYQRLTLVLNATHKYKNYQYNGQKIRDFILHRHLQEELFQIEMISFLDNKLYFKDDKSPIVTTKNFYMCPIYFYATKERISDNIEVNYEYCILHYWIIQAVLAKAYEFERSNIMIPVGEEKILYNSYMDDEEGVTLKEVVADAVYETHNVIHVKEIIAITYPYLQCHWQLSSMFYVD